MILLIQCLKKDLTGSTRTFVPPLDKVKGHCFASKFKNYSKISCTYCFPLSAGRPRFGEKDWPCTPHSAKSPNQVHQVISRNCKLCINTCLLFWTYQNQDVLHVFLYRFTALLSSLANGWLYVLCFPRSMCFPYPVPRSMFFAAINPSKMLVVSIILWEIN